MDTWRLKTRYMVIILCLCIVADIFVYRAVFAPAVLTVSVFEIGKGQGTLLQTPGGATILIDTGADASILRALGTTLPMWRRDIDAVVLTSASSKAIGGLPAVTSRYHVGTTEKSPYGKRLSIDGVYVDVLSTASPSVFKISYGSTSLTVSSSTPPSAYYSDGNTFTKGD